MKGNMARVLDGNAAFLCLRVSFFKEFMWKFEEGKVQLGNKTDKTSEQWSFEIIRLAKKRGESLGGERFGQKIMSFPSFLPSFDFFLTF